MAYPHDSNPTENLFDALFTQHFIIEREWLPLRAYAGREGREWMRLLARRAS